MYEAVSDARPDSILTEARSNSEKQAGSSRHDHAVDGQKSCTT